MSRVSRVRFVGFFHDRGYTPFGDVASEGEAFFSLEDAKDKLRKRANSGGYPCETTLPVCHDDMVATHAYTESREAFFSVTEDAFIDLYPLIPDPAHKGWGHMGNPAYRLCLGPRNGVHVEKF